MSAPPPKRHILVADDSPDNAELIRLAFQKAGFDNPIHTVCRGEEAVQYLKGEGEYADRAKFPLPHLALIDLRMPGMSGWEVLRWIRKQPQFELLQVIVFTGLEHPGDREEAKRLDAAFELKPLSFEELTTIVKRIAEFWINGS